MAVAGQTYGKATCSDCGREASVNGLGSSSHRRGDDRRRRARAEEFAQEHGVQVHTWMLSSVWPLKGWIGCESCAEGGLSAPCWGRASCHGYLNGCGCTSCVREDQVNAREYA